MDIRAMALLPGFLLCSSYFKVLISYICRRVPTYCLLIAVVGKILVPGPEVRVLLVPADVPAVSDQPSVGLCCG